MTSPDSFSCQGELHKFQLNTTHSILILTFNSNSVKFPIFFPTISDQEVLNDCQHETFPHVQKEAKFFVFCFLKIFLGKINASGLSCFKTPTKSSEITKTICSGKEFVQSLRVERGNT